MIQHILQRLLLLISIISLLAAIAILIIDFIIVQPVVDKLKDSISAADPAVRNPPTVVTDMLRRAYGGRLKYNVARQALLDSSPISSHPQRVSAIKSHFGAISVSMLLQFHLTQEEIETAFLSNAKMGAGVDGFASASEIYLKKSLKDVTLEQAAMLVAICHAPSAYLSNPERLDKRVQYLLLLPNS